MPLDVLDHHDRVVHHQPDGEHHCQQRQKVEREPKNLHQKYRTDQRHRDGHHRHQHRAQRAEEEEDHDHHDQQCLEQGLHHFVDRVLNVGRSVVGKGRLDLFGKLFLQCRKLDAGALDHV